MISEDDYYSDEAYNDAFDEDALDDEEYDLLHDMLPPFRTRVQDAKYLDIPDNILKEYIWESNFDPDEAFEIVKENHKRMYIPLFNILLLLTQCHLFRITFLTFTLSVQRASQFQF